MTLPTAWSSGAILAIALSFPAIGSEGRGPVAQCAAQSGGEQFAHWVDRADRYRSEWETESAVLTADQRAAAVRLADRLFGGIWGGYWNDPRGIERAEGPHFGTTARVKRAAPAIVEPARRYLLWRLCAVRAENVRRALGNRAAAEPIFWDAYDRHVRHGAHFGFLKQRAARVIPRVMAESILGFDLYRDGVFNPAGAFGMLASGRYQLARAIDRFEHGDAETGVFFATDAVDSLRRARTFGIQPGRVRELLVEQFGDRLASNEPITVYRERPLSFREVLHDGIAYWKVKAERKAGVDLRPLADLYFSVGANSEATEESALEEHVTVTAGAVHSNVEGFLLRELEIQVDDAAGLPVLERYSDLEIIGKLLLTALLSAPGNEGLYRGVRSTVGQRLADERGERVTGNALTREMVEMGGRILTVPGVVDALGRTPHGARLMGRLALLDSAGFHAHLGNLWVGRALRAGGARDPAAGPALPDERVLAFHEARSQYLEAQRRYPPGEAPAVLQRLADAAARETRTAGETVSGTIDGGRSEGRGSLRPEAR